MNPLPYGIVSGVTFTVAAIWLFGRGTDHDHALPATAQTVLLYVACAGLYLVSHLFRAVRLAVIGVSVYQTSFRTLALLNLAVAPWSLIMPFKLDELVRLNELRTVDRRVFKSLVTIVIDRSMDGPMFVIFSLVLALAGQTRMATFTGIVGVIMIVVTVGFFAASAFLYFVQQYVFVHHHRARALRTLQIVHQLRRVVDLGREAIRATAPIIAICTLGIWLFEISSVALMLLVSGSTDVSVSSALSATLVRANSGWRGLLIGEELGFPLALITQIFFAGLLIIWPFAMWFYCKRRRLENANSEFLGRRWGPGGARG